MYLVIFWHTSAIIVDSGGDTCSRELYKKPVQVNLYKFLEHVILFCARFFLHAESNKALSRIHIDTSTGYRLFIRVKPRKMERSWSLVQAQHL